MRRPTFPLLLLILCGCFDVPVKRAVDVERSGVVIDQSIRFKYADRYSFGFAFRPTFVKDNFWHISKFNAEEPRAWSEFCPTVSVIIRDSNNVIRMSDQSRISREAGWSMTNGTQDGEFPAAVSKFLPFIPVPGERYKLRVAIVERCAGASAVSPHFYIQRPMSGP